MLSKRERNIAIATGVVVGLLGLNYLVVEPVFATLDDLTARHVNLARQVAKDAKTLKDSHAAMLKWKEFRDRGLTTDASKTESGLWNAMSAWAQDASVPLLSFHPDQVTGNDGLHDMTYSATVNGPMHSIAWFLYRAETARSPVRIRELQISPKVEGSDDLSVALRISTLWEDPPTAPPADQAGQAASKPSDEGADEP